MKNTLVFFVLILIPLNVKAEEASSDIVRGALVYEQHCGRCHNFRPPNERSDNDWSIVVAHMRTSAYLTGQQASSVLKFLQASNNPVIDTKKLSTGSDTASAVLGKELFSKNACIGCHEFSGGGGKVGPGLDGVLERRSEEYVKEQLANPRGSNPASVMPAYSFSEVELASLIEYLKSAK